MSKPSMWTSLLLLAVLLAGAVAPLALGQSIYGTITGVVTDPSGAVVPGARVTLTNVGSGDIRRTVTNADGFFTFASVPAASYTVTVENQGFQTWEQTGIALTGAERRNIDISLAVGSAAEKVEVVAATDIVAPVDSGEKAATLTTKQLQDFTVVGRSAAEFIKILPGFAISGTGTSNRSNFSGEVIGINGNGDAGSQSAFNGAYSPNGLGGGSIDITADGAHVSDPGCNCATPVNPNTDMIQEMKVLTSNFSAENSKGPIVLNSIAKAGTRDFHGTGYLYARHYSMNANDALNNSLGVNEFGDMNAPRPENKFWFPGGNIGGPVLIPGTNFNKNRDKLFFFTGFEKYFQTLDTGLLRTTVPTEGMRAGNFSAAELAKLGRTAAGTPARIPLGFEEAGGMIPGSAQSELGKKLLGLYPLPNADPSATGGYNWVRQEVFDQNSLQWMSRVDYSISDNTKLFVRYNLQDEQQLFPVTLWWRNGALPYPTPIVGENQSQSVSASLTHVFSPTLTNEFVFGYTYIAFPNVFQDPDKVSRSGLGINFNGIYDNGVDQIPSIEDPTWNAGYGATIFNPGGFEAGGNRGLFADKFMPSFSDTVSKVWGTHTLKVGGYYEYIINKQPANANSNGDFQLNNNPTSGGTGNQFADLLVGRPWQYNEANKNPMHDIGYHIGEFFVQDSWKATRRLTFELGVRASHLGNWFDRLNNGYAVWYENLYNPNASVNDFPGWSWHGRDDNVANAGFKSTALFWAPRFGIAYDIFGTGNTVFRGGWGRFYYQTPQFTTGIDVAAGQVSTTVCCNRSFAEIEATNPNTLASLSEGIDPTDDNRPLTTSYSATISQKVFGGSLLEVSYVGNQSDNLLNTNRAGSDINAIPGGYLFTLQGVDIGADGFDPNPYRPRKQYQRINLVRRNLYSNYNSMQVTWVRQRGRLNTQVNYTFGKSMGIVGENDLLNIDNNYGVLGNNRTHIFNAAYSIEVGNPVQGNAFLKGLANGWQISGITQWQSGVNLTANSGNLAFDVNYGDARVDGDPINAVTWFGTNAIANVRPILTCDPTANLGERQYLNPSCFAVPTSRGQSGPNVLPAIYGPAFFNSDLSLFKNFQITESQRLQFRFSGYNFLNHPLWSFRPNELRLNIGPGTTLDPNFGTTQEKLGRRIVQLAVKYYF